MHSFNGARHRRNLLDLNGFAPIQFPFTNYTTDSRAKEEMKHTFGDSLFLNNLHLLPDPLKKNLADSVITGEEKIEKDMTQKKEPVTSQRADYYPSLAGITSFFSGVLNVMGAMFQKRATSPPPHYYDCYDEYNEQQRAPSSWQSSKIEVQNKNERVQFGSNNEVNTNLEEEMNKDCRLAATHCEEKLNQVRLLLTNKNIQNVKSTKFHSRRPRKCFVEPGSVEESFEDAFCPEDFVSLSNNTYIEYCSPYNHHYEEFLEVDGPQVKTDICVQESMQKHDYSLEGSNNKETLNEKTVINDNCSVNLTEKVVSSCEDKLSQLKTLLQSKHKKYGNSEQEVKSNESEITNPIPVPVHESLSVDVSDETIFGGEINSKELANSQEDDYFNEVTGKFFSSSLENEDPFQIVFSDSPRNCRRRISSDCESEDSFIVFEESPDSCFISHDIFGEDTVIDDNNTDSDSEFDDDSGITCKLAHNLSQTFGDLTDDSLYSCDVVDSVQAHMPLCNNNVDEKEVIHEERSGLLLNNRKKLEKKKLPPKKVTFSSEPPKVHVMRVWAFAARQARAGHWERHALDRERFKRRIADVEMAISWVFKPQHRSRVVFQRFRPWWNAERRRELAEKKAKEEKEKELKKEEEMRELKNQNDDLENVTDNLIENSTDEDSSDRRNSKEAVRLAKNGYTKQHSQQIETKHASNLNNMQKNIDSNTLVDKKTDIELSEPSVQILHNGYTSNETIVQTNTFNTENSKKLANDEDSFKTPTVNEMMNFTTADDKLSNIIQDIENKDLKVDT